MKLDELRSKFLDYFKSNGHQLVKSSSLVPENDPTLLFTNAGMNQFKDVFLGLEKRPYSRAASSQKCFRASGKHNDLENVGYTSRHHTFFEMLGNFSFGDYFKKDAIGFAWELLAGELKLDKSKLWVTVYKDDEEAFSLWQKVAGVKPERIVRLGEKDNFWSMGDTGPCGPCSEIVFDQGPAVSCGRPDCKVGCDCDRYLELWNLVFMQYNRDGAGKMTPLPRPSIDTGMGLERITAVMQGVLSNYDTDHFRSIIAGVEKLSQKLPQPVVYHRDKHADTSLRVIADHARAMAFLIADGILPGNEGRGYVLRRVMRRAARHARILGFEQPVLFQITGRVVELMGKAFPELIERQAFIAEAVRNEEERFLITLDNGLRLIREEIETHKKDKAPWALPGEVAFKLYDTYGFPLDLTQTIGRDEGFVVDSEGFEREMEKQRARARASWKGSGAEDIEAIFKQIHSVEYPSKFVGYETPKTKARVLLLFNADVVLNEVCEKGSEFYLVTDSTSFYGETGGQVGDTGTITNDEFEAIVVNTKRPYEDLIVHVCKLVRGTLKPGDQVELSVDEERRKDIARNHSATHLLQAALRQTLGGHVQQKGSLVDPDRLRFDFTHFSPMSEKEIAEVERQVNRMIRLNEIIRTELAGYQEAVKAGAMALFGEKYGETVRMVTMGEFSRELCGGTHCSRTGDVGFLKILSESGVAAGVRRVEAVTGRAAVEYVLDREKILAESAGLLKSRPEELVDRISKLMEENKKVRQELKQARIASAGPDLEQMVAQAREINGARVLAVQVDIPDQSALLELSDRLAQKLGKGVLALGSKDSEKAYLVVRVSKELTAKLNAGKLVAKLSETLGGKGGGKPELARGGGSRPEKLAETLEQIYQLVKEPSR